MELESLLHNPLVDHLLNGEKMKRLGFLLAIVASIAAVSFVTTKQAVQRIGPFFTSTIAFDTATGGAVGGQVRFFKSGVDTLFVGEVVYMDKNNRVRKGTTLTLYNAIAGVVVGGTKTNMQAQTSVPVATDTAAYANQQVIVLTEGRFWVRNDAAGTVTFGGLLQPSTNIAGSVMAKIASPDSFYRSPGRMIDSVLASGYGIAHVSVH